MERNSTTSRIVSQEKSLALIASSLYFPKEKNNERFPKENKIGVLAKNIRIFAAHQRYPTLHAARGSK